VCKGMKQERSRESRGLVFINLITHSRLGELNPKFVLLCVLYVLMDFCAEIGNAYDGNWGL